MELLSSAEEVQTYFCESDRNYWMIWSEEMIRALAVIGGITNVQSVARIYVGVDD